jgi:DNA-binding NarL/FixJ family response regulator
MSEQHEQINSTEQVDLESIKMPLRLSAILPAFADGLSNQEIAEQLPSLRPTSINVYIGDIRAIFGTETREEAVIKAKQYLELLDAKQPQAQLLKSERDVLEGFVHGFNKGEISQQLGISSTEVSHISDALFSKLGVGNRIEAARVASNHNLLETWQPNSELPEPENEAQYGEDSPEETLAEIVGKNLGALRQGDKPGMIPWHAKGHNDTGEALRSVSMAQKDRLRTLELKTREIVGTLVQRELINFPELKADEYGLVEPGIGGSLPPGVKNMLVSRGVIERGQNPGITGIVYAMFDRTKKGPVRRAIDALDSNDEVAKTIKKASNIALQEALIAYIDNQKA